MSFVFLEIFMVFGLDNLKKKASIKGIILLNAKNKEIDLHCSEF